MTAMSAFRTCLNFCVFVLSGLRSMEMEKSCTYIVIPKKSSTLNPPLTRPPIKYLPKFFRGVEQETYHNWRNLRCERENLAQYGVARLSATQLYAIRIIRGFLGGFFLRGIRELLESILSALKNTLFKRMEKIA